MRAMMILALTFAALVGCKTSSKPGVDFAFSSGPTFTPASPTSDDTITVDFTIVNSGAHTASATTWQALIDGDPVASGTIPELAPGASASGAFVLNDVQPGAHNLSVIVDPDHLVSEDSAANDDVTVSLPVIAAAARFDLDFPAAPTIDPVTPTTNEATVSFQVRNISSSSAGATNVRWRIFDGTLALGSETIASVPANTTINQSFSLVGTPGGTVGAHAIYVVIDPDNVTNEVDESNNTSPTLNVTIAPSGSG